MDGVKVAKLSAENEQIYKAVYKQLQDMDTINSKRVMPS